jgi:hypothetical protein
MSKTRGFLVIAVILLVSCIAAAQFGGGRMRVQQNYDVPQTEFVFARWQYASGNGWTHDYPDAEEHFNQLMSEATKLSVEKLSYKIVPMESDEIFDYPFAYISEPGQMYLNDQEVKNFREFVDRGGFVMLDDFDGERMFRVMAENIERVFPDREMFQMTDSHHILNTYYQIESLYVESPYDVGGKAEFFGINNESGDLAVIICYNNDIGDYWEWIGNPRYALRPSAEALRMGVNFVLYAMTH